MDDHSLRLLEFDRVTATMAARAATARGAALLSAWRPFTDGAALLAETVLLREAIRRQSEPGEWCHAADGEPGARLAPEATEALDGLGLVEVLGWLEAARATRAAWSEGAKSGRFPALVSLVEGIPALEELRATLARALEPDGRLADGASPALGKLRRGLAQGERELEARLERWARGFGAESYVTRHADRFVALVPAAGFPRKRGIVHDVSGSGQSLFVEPLEACESNNHLIELRAGISAEEARILRELAGNVIDAREEFLSLESGLVHLDTLRARARWAVDVQAIALEPGVSGAADTPGGRPRGRMRLREARHPLLALGERRASLVPLDLDLEPPGTLLLVSGPNMGGKTVLLKTVGLAVVLAHSALPVPAAEGSAVPAIGRVIADLGDEQSVDRGLSTFAAHLARLKLMAEAAADDTLILCDELGAGTDPEEGGSLGRALIEHFAAHGAWGIVTTHLGSLKRVAGEVAGVVNGSLDFDRERMKPRYRFLPGVPGASHALAVAEQLGLPAAVIERARTLTPHETLALEHLIEELQAALRRADEEATELKRARGEAESAAATHRTAIEEARKTVEDLKRRLTRESEVVLGHARELWQTVQREARRADKTRASAESVRAGLEAVEGEAEALRRAADPPLAAFGGPSAAPAGAPARLVVGERVRDRALGVEGEIVTGPDAEGRVLLRRGSFNIQSHVSRIEAAGGGPSEPARARPRGAAASWEAPEEASALEVDLRGMEADEALGMLDQALDRAVLGGMSELRIVHGIGRGILRAVVERHLRGHPQVTSQRMGGAHEGGRGATVARLR